MPTTTGTLQTACGRYGIHFSPAGNGVSHQVHMERFGVPGNLLGSDSHTPGAAGVSMLGIGAGGLDVALAMAGRPYHLPCPKVLGVKLTGSLPDWVSAKDVILEMLPRYRCEGVRWENRRILRAWGQEFFCHGPGNHWEHGNGAGSYRHRLSL